MTTLAIIEDIPEGCDNPIPILDEGMGFYNSFKVANRTWLKRSEDGFVLCHHSTTCVRFVPEGMVVSAGEYFTSSTRERIEAALSVWHTHVLVDKGQWWLVRGKQRRLFENGLLLPYQGPLPAGQSQVPTDPYPQVQGYEYYLEFTDARRTVSRGNCIAIAPLSGRLEGREYVYDGAAAVSGDVPNDAAKDCFVSREEINRECLRVSKFRCMAVHPNLFEFLSEYAPTPEVLVQKAAQEGTGAGARD